MRNTNPVIACECHPVIYSSPVSLSIMMSMERATHISTSEEEATGCRTGTDLRENNNNNIKHLCGGGTAELLLTATADVMAARSQRQTTSNNTRCTATEHRPTEELPAGRPGYIHGA